MYDAALVLIRAFYRCSLKEVLLHCNKTHKMVAVIMEEIILADGFSGTRPSNTQASSLEMDLCQTIAKKSLV